MAVEAPAVRSPAMARRGALLDLAGALLLAAWVLLAMLSSAASGYPAGGYVGLAGAVAAAFVGGRLLAGVRPWLVPAAVLAVGAVLLAGSGAEVLSPQPGAGPFGYVNATATFCAVTGAAGLLLVRWGPPRARRWGLAGTVSSAAVALGSQVRAVGVLAALAALLWALVASGRPRAAITAGMLAWAGAVGLTLMTAAASAAPVMTPAVGMAVGETRVALWAEAFGLMLDRPVLGIGPGGLSMVGHRAASDPDLGHAHNEYLEAGAELGVAGLVLAVAVLWWCLAHLLYSGDSRPSRAIAAFAVAAVGMHATVDYVLHFTLVGMGTAALVGAVTSYGLSRGGGER